MSVHNGSVRIFDEDGRSVKITLSGDDADIFLGGNGKNGDLVLFRRDVTDHREHDRATIHLHGRDGDALLGGNGVDGDIVIRNREGNERIRILGGDGDIWIGGNGRNGDILLFPHNARNIRDPDQATLSLNGSEGNLNLRGNIKFTARVTSDRQLPGWSIDEGATAAFQGTQRAGLVDFTHTHPPARGDREKLREIWIFNPELDDESIVLLTAHEGAPCAYMVSETSHHSISGGEGHFINIVFTRKINPGNRVRIKYYIIN